MTGEPDYLVIGLVVCGIISGTVFIAGVIFHAWVVATGRIKPWPRIPKLPVFLPPADCLVCNARREKREQK